jgi:predicted tellurium resistance membrane protein TerC
MPKRHVFVVLVFVVAILAADSPPPPEAVDVEVVASTVDGRTITGQLLTPVLRLKTDYGFQEIETKRVRRIAFRPAESEKGNDKVELQDKTHQHGVLLTPALQIKVDDRVESFSPRALRELKTVQKQSASLTSILIGLVTLSLMEIVLGIDNIIFLAIVAGRLPPAQQPRARRLGLIAALGTRLLLLASLSFLLGLTKPLFTLPEMPLIHELEAREVSLRDLILLVGGMFLIGKSVHEMHEKLEAAKHTGPRVTKMASFGSVLIQIAILDIIFSLDSVITAVGMVEELWVMITAMVIAMVVMMLFAGTISNFVAKHPTIKVLALAFLILIGVLLVAESLGQHIDKGYIYFAMAFAVVIEMINIRTRKTPVPPIVHEPIISPPIP